MSPFEFALARNGAVAVLVYLVGVVVFLIVGALSVGPGSADAAFYASAANSIAHGHFDVNFLWSFNEVGAVIPPQPQLPVPIGGHWLPGAALVAAPFVWLFGPAWPAPTFGASLVAALAAPVAWWLAIDLGARRPVAFGATLLVIVAGALLPFLTQPDNHSLSAGVGSLGLLLAGRAALGSGRAMVGAAACGGLMLLVRNDALLYLLPLAYATWLGRRTLSRRSMFGAFVALVLIVAPWWAHQLLVFGTLSPSAAAGRSLWIIDLNEFNRLGTLSLSDFLANGLPAIVASRVAGFSSALTIHGLFFAAGGLLLPFALFEGVRRRDRLVLRPTLLFAGAFVSAAVLLFAVHVPNGMYIRSGAALMPATIVLGVAGLDGLLTRVASQRALRTSRFAAFSLVATVQLLLALVVTTRSISDWSNRASEWRWVAAELAVHAGPTDGIETYDAAGAFWYTGHPSVSTPNESADTLLDVARAYRLSWLVVLEGETIPATAQLLDQGSLPWLGAPIARLIAADGQTTATVFPINR